MTHITILASQNNRSLSLFCRKYYLYSLKLGLCENTSTIKSKWVNNYFLGAKVEKYS